MRTLGLIMAVMAMTVLLVSGRANAELVAGQATTVSHPMLQVSGSGTVQVVPDTVRITASVVTQAATVEEARERNAEIAQRALEAVKALKLRNVVARTVAYAMQRVTRDASITNNRIDPSVLSIMPWKLPAKLSGDAYFTFPFPVLLGYEATNSVTVRVQGVPADELSASAGRIVDALMTSGCNQITGVAYSLEQDQTAARREALAKAVRDAQMTAETVAAAAGRKVTGIRSITPSYSLGPSDFMRPYGFRGGGFGVGGGMGGGGMGGLGSDQPVATALASGQLELAAQVQVSYELDYNAGETQFLSVPAK